LVFYTSGFRDDGNFGPELNRGRERGSPVVPGSCKKVVSIEAHDHSLYLLTILKGHYEAGTLDGDEFCNGCFIDYEEKFLKACREQKVTIRDITPDMLGEEMKGEEEEDEKGAEEQEEEILSQLQNLKVILNKRIFLKLLMNECRQPRSGGVRFITLIL